MPTSLFLGLLLACALTATRAANYGSDPYDEITEDLLLRELQKRLSLLEGGPGFYGDEYEPALDDQVEYGIPLDSRDSGQMENRDREYLEHSSNNDGFQYISGGAGEGKQHLTPEGTQDNVHEVKSDETLPFYCHPPNPCPKGYTEKDGCQEFIEDSAQEQKYWIEEMQTRGMCHCDEEHMFSCPQDKANADRPASNPAKDNLDQLLGKMLDNEGNNPWMKGQKRGNLIAKKSPRVKRSVNYAAINQELDKMQKKNDLNNPFMTGDHISTYAKKMSIKY